MQDIFSHDVDEYIYSHLCMHMVLLLSSDVDPYPVLGQACGSAGQAGEDESYAAAERQAAPAALRLLGQLCSGSLPIQQRLVERGKQDVWTGTAWLHGMGSKEAQDNYLPML